MRKIFLSDKDESQIRSSVLSVPFNKIIPSPRSKSTLPWSACCENNDKSSFGFSNMALVSLGCTSHGILHTLVTFASDSVCEPLPRIVTKTPNVFSHIPAASLSLSWLLIQCLSFHCHQKVASRSFFRNVKENSEDFQLIRIAGCFSQWNLATFLLPSASVYWASTLCQGYEYNDE